MKKKKLLATLLAAGMLFSVFPATTSAEAVQKTDLGKTAVRTAADEPGAPDVGGAEQRQRARVLGCVPCAAAAVYFPGQEQI